MRAFIAAAELQVTEQKGYSDLKNFPEMKYLAFMDYPCVLQRKSTLREQSTVVGGAAEIMRFLYAAETIDYHWYPQNPLDRVKLDSVIVWMDKHKN